ncbi:MAG: DUF2155 domain-containing protein [Rhodospirillaceae bacterium]|nr:DUF2155 domain-containing protein [Rhodospirillaceae bacterium]
MIALMKHTVAAITAILIFAGFAPVANADPHGRAVLQGLDKVTARVSTREAALGESVRFGTLEVIVRHCDKRPPEETPESAAFLDIWEVRPDEPATSIFRGWMFASSPALHALEHPVYDVWVLDCKEKLPEGGVLEAPDGEEGEEEEPDSTKESGG